jgi:hypothetical protein
MRTRWSNVIHRELWEANGEKHIILERIMRKWRRVGHTLRKGMSQ